MGSERGSGVPGPVGPPLRDVRSRTERRTGALPPRRAGGEEPRRPPRLPVPPGERGPPRRRGARVPPRGGGAEARRRGSAGPVREGDDSGIAGLRNAGLRGAPRPPRGAAACVDGPQALRPALLGSPRGGAIRRARSL